MSEWFVDGLEDIEEDKPVAAGVYKVQVEAIDYKTKKDSEEKQVVLRLSFPDEPDAPNIFHNSLISLRVFHEYSIGQNRL